MKNGIVYYRNCGDKGAPGLREGRGELDRLCWKTGQAKSYDVESDPDSLGAYRASATSLLILCNCKEYDLPISK